MESSTTLRLVAPLQTSSLREIVEKVLQLRKAIFLLGVHVQMNVSCTFWVDAFDAMAIARCMLCEVPLTEIDGQPSLMLVQFCIDEIAVLIRRDTRMPSVNVIDVFFPEAPVQVQVT